METHNVDFEQIMNTLGKYAVLIATFLFSLIAKVHTMMAYKKRMTKVQCAIEFFLSGSGGAITIWVLHKMDVPQWVLCGVGGFSSLIITPMATVVTKNATPILESLAVDLKALLHKWFKAKE